MIKLVIFSIVITLITIVIHALGTSSMIRFIFNKIDLDTTPIHRKQILFALSFSATSLILLHFAEIILWALTFMMIPEIARLSNFQEAVYFSSITYTTVGYGDITLEGRWRLLCGFEAMNGILLFGWSSAVFFSIIQRIVGQTKRMGNILKKP
jgi:voltage-gated potassium channel Kch